MMAITYKNKIESAIYSST